MKVLFLLSLLIFSGLGVAYAEENQNTSPSSLQEFVSVNALQSDSLPIMHSDLSGHDSTANTIAILLLGIPFGILVYRMSDSDPIPQKYSKISGIVVAFAMIL